MPNNGCETCGTWVLAPGGVHCCGRCATDWNDPNKEAGRRRINSRRQANGMAPLAKPEHEPEDAVLNPDAER